LADISIINETYSSVKCEKFGEFFGEFFIEIPNGVCYINLQLNRKHFCVRVGRQKPGLHIFYLLLYVIASSRFVLKHEIFCDTFLCMWLEILKWLASEITAYSDM